VVTFEEVAYYGNFNMVVIFLLKQF
jgi:hypothetical protein